MGVSTSKMAKGSENGDAAAGVPAPTLALRVVVVDDDPFVATSLATILAAEPDIQVVGRGCSGQEAIALFEQAHPDVLLMDIQMPGMSGLEAAERILAQHPHAVVAFLTTFSDDEYIVRALRLGARGYLIKQEVSTIAPALRSLHAGQNVLGGEVVGRLDVLMRAGGTAPAEAVLGTGARTTAKPGAAAGDGAYGGEPGACRTRHGAGDAEGARATSGFALQDVLSEREYEIMALVAEGLDNREIAGRLYLSEGTVRNHISAMLQKLALKNRTQLAIFYYRNR